MKQLVIICGENKLRCWEILQLLNKRNEDSEIILRVTTNTNDNVGCLVVSKNEFWDMVEQGKFFEYSGTKDGYYGTLHIKNETINNCFMINDVGVALDIKKIYPKTITIYVLSKEFKPAIKARKLDFLVIDEALTDTAIKVEEIVKFIEKNGMK